MSITIVTRKMYGLVDLGEFTEESERYKLADHGLVIYYRPFQGTWGQAVGFYTSRAAASGKALKNLVLDAFVKLEEVGLYVDCVVSDGASASEFGIGFGDDGTIINSLIHPCDENRRLYFLSDIIHLFKCMWNWLLQSGKFEVRYMKV